MGCKGICARYKAQKTRDESRYSNGQKRCSKCEIYINWDGNNCPCCSMILRTRPRSAKDRERYPGANIITRM